MADLDAAWTRLEAAAKAAGDKRIVEFFDAEPGRLEALTLDVAGLHLDLSKQAWDEAGLEAALDQPLTRIMEQVQLALENGKEKPDVIYLTGGSARSPLIKKALAEQLPGIPIAGGDDFGSVTAGLARWAQVMFS